MLVYSNSANNQFLGQTRVSLAYKHTPILNIEPLKWIFRNVSICMPEKCTYQFMSLLTENTSLPILYKHLKYM